MRKPYVVAINAISGGGKTSLATLLHESLPDSSLFCFDDFDSTNVYPPDYHEWWAMGGNLEEFDCPGMRAAVDVEIRTGRKRYIVMDYPFGRDHSRFRDVIDLSVWIETPLDVAMARRIRRDFVSQTTLSAPELQDRLKTELDQYLGGGRPLYLDDRHMKTADLVLDGSKSLQDLRDSILEALNQDSKQTPG
jgi:uridine kinase